MASAPDVLAAGLDIAYQPIVHLGSGAVIAYEALARPRHPEASNPFQFFRFLEQAGLRLPGERAAFEAALTGVHVGFPRVKLFLNASPLTLIDPDFDPLELRHLVEGHGLAANDIVIEVTESEEVDDLAALARRTQVLRRLGMGVAVDDAGAGHASFRVITRLRPSFIKIDRDLVRDVDKDGARHAFIEALVRFARQIGSRLIAEGIETEGELASLTGLGVEAGQGYFLARPALGQFVNPSPDSRRMIASAAQRMRVDGGLVNVAEIMRPAELVSPSTTLREAYQRFVEDDSLGVLVLADAGRVIGQLPRRTFERLMSSPGAWDWLGDRAIREFADTQPVSIGEQQDVLELAATLAASPSRNLADDVVVSDARGRPAGVVPVREVIRTLAAMHRHGEEDVHPITGMMGPSRLEHELRDRLKAETAACVVFVDINHLRLVNAVGGFVLGDAVLRALARCLAGVVIGIDDGAVAHLGADNFGLVLPPAMREQVVPDIVRSFEQQVMPLLRVAMREEGAAHHLERVGLSIAAVTLQGDPPSGHRYLEWATALLTAPLRTAQDHPGYAYVAREGDALSLAVWQTDGRRRRSISLGLVHPALLLRALARVEDAWRQWCEAHMVAGEMPFPGPCAVTDGLLARFWQPLQEAAQHALEAGQASVDFALDGCEEELLDLLDRVAIVVEDIMKNPRAQLPPELALVSRMLRQRARVVTRVDLEPNYAASDTASDTG